MEQILSSLLNFGIGGMMAAAILYFLHTMVTKTIPEMVKTHQEVMKEQQTTFRDAVEAITARLERLAEYSTKTYSQIEALDRHTRANIDQIVAVREHVTRITDSSLAGRPKT